MGVILVKELYQLICPIEEVADKMAAPEQIKSSVVAVIIGLSFFGASKDYILLF